MKRGKYHLPNWAQLTRIEQESGIGHETVYVVREHGWHGMNVCDSYAGSLDAARWLRKGIIRDQVSNGVSVRTAIEMTSITPHSLHY